jgi:hypothetical protein
METLAKLEIQLAMQTMQKDGVFTYNTARVAISAKILGFAGRPPIRNKYFVASPAEPRSDADFRKSPIFRKSPNFRTPRFSENPRFSEFPDPPISPGRPKSPNFPILSILKIVNSVTEWDILESERGFIRFDLTAAPWFPQ